jgi:hypothetical protein
VAVVLGAFLPWVQASDGLQTVYDYPMGHNREAPILALVGAALVVLALVFRTNVRKGAIIPLGILSGVAVVDAMYMLSQVPQLFNAYAYTYGVDARPSVGLPLIMLGGIAGLVATGLACAASTTQNR